MAGGRHVWQYARDLREDIVGPVRLIGVLQCRLQHLCELRAVAGGSLRGAGEREGCDDEERPQHAAYFFVVAFRHFGDCAVHESWPLLWIVAFTG